MDITIKKLTVRQTKALQALLAGDNVTDAANSAGCARGTVYEWLRQDHFRSELVAAETMALQSISRSLVALAEQAVNTLREALDSGEAIPTRIRAADVILGRLLQLRQLADLENRVTALEEMNHE